MMSKLAELETRLQGIFEKMVCDGCSVIYIAGGVRAIAKLYVNDVPNISFHTKQTQQYKNMEGYRTTLEHLLLEAKNDLGDEHVQFVPVYLTCSLQKLGNDIAIKIV